MNSDEQIERLLMQLVRETSIGNVRWRLSEPHYYLNNATEDHVVSHFGANYNGLDVGVFETRYKYWHDEDAFYWYTGAGFSVVMNGSLIVDYRRPSASLNQLLDMARSQAIDIENILKGSLF